MRKSAFGLYTPLLVVVLIQAVIIAVAPSNSPTVADAGPAAAADSGDAAPGTADPGTGTTAPAPAGGDATSQATTAADGAAPSSSGATTPSSNAADGAGGSAAGTSGGGGDAVSGPSGGDAGSVAQQGDTSHCTEDGYQHDVVYFAPPCVPAWPDGADNGGATYQGVTADTITVLLFRENKNEQVTTLLNQYNLRATRAEDEEFMEAAQDVLNERYEFYGRELDLVLFDATNCPETPPDVPACRAEAQRAIKEHQPFAVIWPIPNYPTVFDEFVKAGVISIGGWHFEQSFFEGRRPYRWDLFMDGTRSADVIGEYYCGKLANGNATHAGRIIHPSFPNGGQRDLTPRKLGIIVQETPANAPNGERVEQIVGRCDRHQPVMFTYVSDIERAQQQSAAITQGLIDAEVTTVVCMCDPIAPIFRMQDQTNNNYYPEILLPGLGLLDYDLLGRLYDKNQMAHAFGPSHLQVARDHSDSDASRMWRASGRDGDACASCNLNGSYFSMLGAMLQVAGPELTPFTVEEGMLGLADRGGWAESGGNPHYVLARFGQGDYTLLSDYKEVHWSETEISRIDGNPGAYVPMDGGRRFVPGQGELPPELTIPQPPR